MHGIASSLDLHGLHDTKAPETEAAANAGAYATPFFTTIWVDRH